VASGGSIHVVWGEAERGGLEIGGWGLAEGGGGVQFGWVQGLGVNGDCIGCVPGVRVAACGVFREVGGVEVGCAVARWSYMAGSI
jgi:hypothetical protein